MRLEVNQIPKSWNPKIQQNTKIAFGTLGECVQLFEKKRNRATSCPAGHFVRTREALTSFSIVGHSTEPWRVYKRSTDPIYANACTINPQGEKMFDNKAIVAKLLDALWNKGQFSVADELSLDAFLRFSCSFFRSGSRIITAARS
jgi:hypothetical protein